MANNTEWPKLPKLPKDVLSRLAKCLALVPDRKLKPEDAPCVMGGKPPLPEGVAWPERDGELLTYVGRVNTTAAHDLFEEVPDAGWLLFFHEPDDERLQTIVVTEELGEPKGPPKGSKYLVVDMRCGPDDGKVSAAMACRFVPAWSYTYDPDADLDEDVTDALDALKPEKAIGQLLGHAFFEEEYSCKRAVGVAESHASGRYSTGSLSEEKLMAMRKQAQAVPPPPVHIFACSKLGRRLKSLVDELKASESEWKQRAKEKGKSWSNKLSAACKGLQDDHAETIEQMAQGKALGLAPMIAAFKAWETAFYVMENAQYEKRIDYLYEWSKELRAKQAQIGNLSEENEEERLKKAERDEARKMKTKYGGSSNQEYEDLVERTRNRLFLPITGEILEASMKGRNLLETGTWAMKELEKIGDRIEGSEASQVLTDVMNLLSRDDSQKQSGKGGMSVAEIDAVLANMKKSRAVNKAEPVKVTKQWRMLLSFDSRLDYCWSDSGSIRYFIETKKLAKGEFDRVVSDIESG